MLAAHDNSLVLKPFGDSSSVDLEFCGQFVDRGPRLVAFRQAFKLSDGEVQGPSRMLSGWSYATRTR